MIELIQQKSMNKKIFTNFIYRPIKKFLFYERRDFLHMTYGLPHFSTGELSFNNRKAFGFPSRLKRKWRSSFFPSLIEESPFLQTHLSQETGGPCRCSTFHLLQEKPCDLLRPFFLQRLEFIGNFMKLNTKYEKQRRVSLGN